MKVSDILRLKGNALFTITPDEPLADAVNIMADKEIPYALLKKVMMTCGAADFARISLSVNHVGKPGQ